MYLNDEEGSMSRSRVMVAGAGSVGALSAAVMAARRLGEISLYDSVHSLARGKAMDINHASACLSLPTAVVALDDIVAVDVVVITAGMSRLDLLQRNLEVMHTLGGRIMSVCPQALVLAVTNPVDVLTWYLKHTWPEMRVFGLGCTLDSVRFRYFIAEALGGTVASAQGIVIGAHNEYMLPLVRHATYNGLPLKELLDDGAIEGIVARTRMAGTEIVTALKVHSGNYAAAHTIARVVEAIVLDRTDAFPLSVYCAGEYGYRDICLALPAMVNGHGIQRILEVDLDDGEQAALDGCAQSLRGTLQRLNRDKGFLSGGKVPGSH